MTTTINPSMSQNGTTARPVWSGTHTRLAGVAGILYLLVAILGGFAQGFVYPAVERAGNAAATVAYLAQHASTVRLAVVADLAQATVWIALALTLHHLLRRVHRPAARAMVVLVAVGAGITMLAAVFQIAALRCATRAMDVGGLDASSTNALSTLLVDTHHHGLLVAQIFFGLWLVPLGMLAYRSGWFPRALGALLVLGGLCYLVDTFVALLSSELSAAIHGPLVIPCVVAEVWAVGALLWRGVRRPLVANVVPV